MHLIHYRAQAKNAGCQQQLSNTWAFSARFVLLWAKLLLLAGVLPPRRVAAPAHGPRALHCPHSSGVRVGTALRGLPGTVPDPQPHVLSCRGVELLSVPRHLRLWVKDGIVVCSAELKSQAISSLWKREKKNLFFFFPPQRKAIS